MAIRPVYWTGKVPTVDDFGLAIDDEFVDGATRLGRWGYMSPRSFREYGFGLGIGLGQKYQRQADGRWLKVLRSGRT